MKLLICAWIFFCTSPVSFATALPGEPNMYWTPEARDAYALVSALRVDEGLTLIRLHAITQPDNYIWPYLEDYAEFLRIFVQEDMRKIPAFLAASVQRQSKIEAIPESNPLSLMAQGQILLHQCALHLQQGQFIAAATDINQSFKLLRKNQKLHPNDVANLRLYASLKVAFGAVPDQYRFLVSILTSLTGTIEEGLKELHGILETTTPENNIFFKETVLYAALAEGQLDNNPHAALDLIYKYLGHEPESKAVQYMMASLLIADGNNDGAIRVLSKEVGTVGSERIPFLDFMMGECKLFRGDVDADVYFKNFLVYHKGKHFIKEAHQKLAWQALLKGDRNGYYNHMQQILIKGASTTDEDKAALIEAETHATPHPVLLRARLYYDGGYYDKALDQLTETFYSSLNQHAQRLEYLYRKGRILQAQKAYPEALHFLALTISTGQYEKYYYACSAALQCGIIHELLENLPTASKFYLMCLDMDPETYSTGLHQKARAGLNRVGG